MQGWKIKPEPNPKQTKATKTPNQPKQTEISNLA